MASFYLGTSGFAYEPWRHGVFYPEGVAASGMLRHYATVFRSVEINYTFRRYPTDKVLTAWREQTPDDFRFTLKAHMRITQIRRLRDAGADVRDFVDRCGALGNRLGPLLFKCPQGLAYDEKLLRAFAADLPPGVRAVMDFRDPSWSEARALVAENGLAWCVADTDEAVASDGDWTEQPFAYLRLRRAEYSDAELETWAVRIRSALDRGRDVYCYFKHEDSAAGPRMALRLEQAIRATSLPP
ncbi:MAG: hypothetical protein QOF68_2060 [Gaiellales bacterium]|nr:hypothetical protein [Gaiellales bacterium]